MEIDEAKRMMKDSDFMSAARVLEGVVQSVSADVEAKLLYGICCRMNGDLDTFIRIDDEVSESPSLRATPLWGKYHAMRIAACGVMLLAVGVAEATPKTVYGGPSIGDPDIVIIGGGGEKTVYAGPVDQCLKKTGTIKFRGGGGGGTMPLVYVTVSSCSDSTLTLPSCSFSRVGYWCSGWRLSGCCFLDEPAGHPIGSKINVSDFMDPAFSDTLMIDATAMWVDAGAVSSSQNGYSGFVKLSWKSLPGAKDYLVYRGRSSDRSAAMRVATMTSSAYYDNAASPGAQYWYWIVPRDVFGQSHENVFSVVTGMRALDVPVPSVEFNRRTGYIAVGWPAVEGAADYAVYRSTDPTFSWSTTKRLVITGNCFYYDQPSNSNPVPGVKYYYWIGPRTPSYTYVSSTRSQVGMRALAAPQPSVTTTRTKDILVAWPSVEGAKDYAVFRSTSSTFSWDKRIAIMRGTSYYDTQAVPGQTYYYWICPRTEFYTYNVPAAFARGMRAR